MSTGHGDVEGEVEALIVDRYLDALLGRRPTDAWDLPIGVRIAARVLASDLPRFHPSFRFEEHLARRLAQATGAVPSTETRGPTTSGADVVMFPGQRRAQPTGGAMRPVVIGGVLTSAALSLVGAVFVAWRRSHHAPEAAMVRAIRAVARTRPI